MSCKRTETLRQMLISAPDHLDTPEWEQHLHVCHECKKEAHLWNYSLKVYLQLENPEQYPVSGLQTWEQLQSRLDSGKVNQWYRYLAVAAVFAFIVGLSGWWYQMYSLEPDIPAHYQIVNIQPGEPFGSPNATTRVIWNNQQFGLSIEFTAAQERYSAISIGMRLTKPERPHAKKSAQTSSKMAYQTKKQRIVL